MHSGRLTRGDILQGVISGQRKPFLAHPCQHLESIKDGFANAERVEDRPRSLETSHPVEVECPLGDQFEVDVLSVHQVEQLLDAPDEEDGIVGRIAKPEVRVVVDSGR